MGILGDLWVGEYNGHPIEVEGSVGFLVAAFTLSIDHKKVVDTKVTFGETSLRSQIGHDGKDLPVVVRISQGLFGTSAVLEVDGRRMPFERRK